MSEKEYYKDNDDLNEVACNVESHLLLCYHPKCTKQFTKSSTIWTIDNEFDWLLRLKCKKCKMQWAVCFKCSSCKSALLTKRQISLHKNTYHKSNDSKNPPTKRTKSVIDDIDEYLMVKKQKINNNNNENKIVKELPSNDQVISNTYLNNSSTIISSENDNFHSNDLLSTQHDIMNTCDSQVISSYKKGK